MKDILPFSIVALILGVAATFYGVLSGSNNNLSVGKAPGQQQVTQSPGQQGQKKSNLPKLSLSVDKKSLKVQEVFTVSINLDTKGTLVQGADVTLIFDPQKLQVLDSDPNTSGLQVTAGTIFTNPLVLANRVDNQNGKVVLSISSFTPFTGQGIYGTVNMRALTHVSWTAISFAPSPDTKVTIANTKGVETGIGGMTPLDLTVIQ